MKKRGKTQEEPIEEVQEEVPQAQSKRRRTEDPENNDDNSGEHKSKKQKTQKTTKKKKSNSKNNKNNHNNNNIIQNNPVDLQLPADLALYICKFLSSGQDLMNLGLMNKHYNKLVLENIRDPTNKKSSILHLFTKPCIIIQMRKDLKKLPNVPKRKQKNRKGINPKDIEGHFKVGRCFANGTLHGELTSVDCERDHWKEIIIRNTNRFETNKTGTKKVNFFVDDEDVPYLAEVLDKSGKIIKTGNKWLGVYDGTVVSTRQHARHLGVKQDWSFLTMTPRTQKTVTYERGEVKTRRVDYLAAANEYSHTIFNYNPKGFVQWDFSLPDGSLSIRTTKGESYREKEVFDQQGFIESRSATNELSDTQHLVTTEEWSDGVMTSSFIVMATIDPKQKRETAARQQTLKRWSKGGLCLYWADPGSRRKYWPDGSLRDQVPMVNGYEQGTMEEYSQQGHLTRRANYVKGKQHGLVEVFFNNASRTAQSRANYVEGKIDGKRELFDERGVLSSILHYKDGEMISEEVINKELEN